MRPKNQLNRCSSEGLVAAGRTKENHQSAHAVMTRKKRNGDTVDTLSLSVAISAVLEQELDLSKPSHTGESPLSTPTHPSPLALCPLAHATVRSTTHSGLPIPP